MSVDDFDWDKCEKGYKAKIVLEDFYNSVGANISIDIGSLFKDMDYFLDFYDLPAVYWPHDAPSV